MLDKQLIHAIASKRIALLCIECPNDGVSTMYFERLQALLEHCGLNVRIMSPSDFARSTPLLSLSPEETFAITSSPQIAEMMTAVGMLTIGISPQETLAGAAFVLPDLWSIYAFMGWIWFSKRINPGEHIEIQKKVTAIIPAAGKGTRLGFDKPKILYPFGSATALDIMYAKVSSIAERIIIIASTEGEPLIREHLLSRGLRAEIIVDPNPYGTGGSVAVALDKIKETEQVLVIWGDQIGVPREALKQIVYLHSKHGADFSLPTRLRKKPYIHLERNEEGIVKKVLRRRFNDIMPNYGENELGVFLLRGNILKQVLGDMKDRYWIKRKESEIKGELPGEFDFLEIIPEMASRNYTIITSPFVFIDAALGFNTLEEAQELSQQLQRGADL